MLKYSHEKKLLLKMNLLRCLLLGDPSFIVLASFYHKRNRQRGKTDSWQVFGFRLPSAQMVNEYVFGRLKARFGCFRREMDIILEDLPNVIMLALFSIIFGRKEKSF